MVRVTYPDRTAAGRALAAALGHLAGRAGLLVLGLPRGGVPVAAEVAVALHAPLDVLVVRKLGLPGRPELAMGAIAGVGGDVETVRNAEVIAGAEPDPAAVAEVLDRELTELRRREAAYRGGRPPARVQGRTVLVVDDGLATGATVRAAVAAVRRGDPARVVVAAPVGAAGSVQELGRVADEVVCPLTPRPFRAVGQAYDDFGETTDDEVRAALAGRG